MRYSGKFAGRVLAKGFVALLVSASPLAMGCAHAADADAAATPAPAASDSVEIVVTATKRSESMQTVPLAMTAMTSEQLTQHHVAGFDDYAKMLPSVSFQSFGPGQSQFYFRGITNGGDGIASGPLPASGLYLDEVPLTTIAGSVDVHIYDISRIEALSGPQGTLYGASSMSGTLRIITNQPKLDKWEGGIDVEGNKFGPGAAGGKVEGFINVPIGQNAALRASAFYQHDGGYIDNVYGERIYTQAHTLSDGSVADVNGAYNNSKYVKNNFNDVNTAGGRAALKVDLNENWTVTPAIMYQNLITHGTFLYGPLGHQSDPATAPLGDLQVHDFTPDRTTDDWYMASMTINGKLSNWDITYSGSYFDRRQDITADYSYFTVAYDQLYTDYTYFSHNGTAIDPSQTYHSHDKYTKFSQELRISSPGHDRFRVTAGLFMQRQTDAHIADYIVNGLSTSDQAAGIQIPGAPGDDVYYTNFNRVDRDYAMFGEASYDIIDHVTLTGGIRGFIADNTLNGFSGSQSGFYHAGAALGCAASTTVFTCPNIDKKLVESGETHKISLKWQVDPTKMLYATYSTGFRPGGNNRAAYVQVGNVYKEQSPPPFNADKLTNYEIGWKTSLFDHKLRFNGAVFLENWNNVQYAQPGVLGIIFTMNASEARSKGVEAELAWRVVHGLTLSASGTYVDAKLAKDFTCPLTAGCGYYLNGNPVNLGSVIAPAGTRLPVTPKVKVSATARYETKLADFDAFLQGGLTYQGDVPNSLRPDYQAVLGSSAAFTTADFSAGIAKDQWTLSTFISNAFDVRGALSKNLACSSTPCLTYARSYITKPQQFGLRAGYKF